MALINLFKLEKMSIEAYTKVGRGVADKAIPARMELSFNPASLEESHAIGYQGATRRAINSPAAEASYTYTPPTKLALTFVLDGTGVDYYFKAQQLLAGATVARQIATFKKMCWAMNGKVHQPNFLVLSWGRFVFACRLETLGITYTLFDKGGNPLRAELKVQFVKDASAATILREAAKSSPDLTHVRTVQAGDTLPLLCQEIYGSPVHYLRVARANDLDDFRNLQPGQRLAFAPLADDDGGDGGGDGSGGGPA